MTGHLAEVLELCRYPVRGGFSLVSDSNIYGEVISCSKSQEHGAPAPLGGRCHLLSCSGPQKTQAIEPPELQSPGLLLPDSLPFPGAIFLPFKASSVPHPRHSLLPPLPSIFA